MATAVNLANHSPGAIPRISGESFLFKNWGVFLKSIPSTANYTPQAEHSRERIQNKNV